MHRPKKSKATIEPHHDPIARWCLENIGELPGPEMVRWLKPRLERTGLLLNPEHAAEMYAADLLAMGDPEAGIEPFDPLVEAEHLARRGIDATRDPHFAKLADLAALGIARLKRTQRGLRDPKAPQRAKSARAEKALQKAKKAGEASKVRRREALRDESRDKAILAEIHSFLKVGVGVRFTPFKRELVSPLSSSPLLPKTPSGRSTTYDPVIWLPLWSKASLTLRAMAMGIAAGRQGGLDFTLHLGDSGIAYGMGVGEMQFASRLHRRIRDALIRECPKAGYPAPSFFFLVEQGKGERSHLHGVILAPSMPSHKRHLRTVLRNAVGTDWKPKGRDKTQVEFGSLFEPAGWVKYITKYLELTKGALGNNIFASSRAITQAGQEWYDNMRATRGLLLPGKAVPIRSA